LIYDAVAARFPDRPIVAVGFSIGTGVAAHLARKRPLAGAILVTPFDALAEVGHEHYPWLPVRLLLRHHMHPAADLEASEVPVALIVAGRDSIIPPRRAEALARRVQNLVHQRTIPGAGHNDIYQHPDFPPTLTDALKRVSTAS
jgi:pimeloyl-ACP methyl ester carboxylesterase